MKVYPSKQKHDEMPLTNIVEMIEKRVENYKPPEN